MNDAVATVRAFLGDVAKDGDVARIEDLVSSNFEGSFPFVSDEIVRGYEGYSMIASVTRSVFPDLTAVVEHVALGPDGTVVSTLRASGTHSREWCGIAPTFKRLEWKVLHVTEVTDGRITRDDVMVDRLELLEQMGAELSARFVHAPDGLAAKVREIEAPEATS